MPETNMNTSFYKKHTGFTLIEVMVSVSIFAIILTVGIGSLLTINNAYRKSQSERVVIDNLNFTLESMAREIRVGTQYQCSPACSTGNSKTIRFKDPDGLDISYAFQNVNGQGRIIKDGASGNIGALTDPAFINIDINKSRFIVLNEDPNDNRQPYVIISITGTTTANNQVSTYSLQTAVTQRQLDVAPTTP